MPPTADGSSTRGGSTSVRGRVRSPHISSGRPTAGSQRANNLGSCSTQPVCCILGWDRQTDGRTDGRIAVSLNAPLRPGGAGAGRHNKQEMMLCLAFMFFSYFKCRAGFKGGGQTGQLPRAKGPPQNSKKLLPEET